MHGLRSNSNRHGISRWAIRASWKGKHITTGTASCTGAATAAPGSSVLLHQLLQVLQPALVGTGDESDDAGIVLRFWRRCARILAAELTDPGHDAATLPVGLDAHRRQVPIDRQR